MNESQRNPLRDFVTSDDDQKAELALHEALQALPLTELSKSEQTNAWQNIAGQLKAGDKSVTRLKPMRSWLRSEEWMGLAAVLVLAVTVVFMQRPEPVNNIVVQPVDDQKTVQLAEWIEHSQQLESQLRSLRSRATRRVFSGQKAQAVDELERMIGIVDLQIAVSQVVTDQHTDNDFLVNERTGLWQQRVRLLNELLVNQFAQQINPYSDSGSAVAASYQQI